MILSLNILINKKNPIIFINFDTTILLHFFYMICIKKKKIIVILQKGKLVSLSNIEFFNFGMIIRCYTIPYHTHLN